MQTFLFYVYGKYFSSLKKSNDHTNIVKRIKAMKKNSNCLSGVHKIRTSPLWFFYQKREIMLLDQTLFKQMKIK